MEHRVYVVDDDDAVRHSISRLLASDGYAATDFPSSLAFLSHPFPSVPSCLILDMNMPEANGFEVAEKLAQRGHEIPIIFLTGYGTIPMTVKAMKAGAHEFLTKPVVAEQLLKAVAEGLQLSARNFSLSCEQLELKQRHQTLTPRESEVMELAIGGLLNKQIATALGISEITAKVHKRRVMEKMQVRSLADLVRAAERLNILKAGSR
ncbi:response regulator transcription factor [Nissabacter sp. SGAir0207]|uniref:response regulator transcription factor n=1 Tax=Nissabacter sp. SGAir0207 TaxID=2126321 RepID=UPI0010CCFEF3|nr:response regulator [Nissabacter sp. SGAir0207]QCR38220.1 DNA-binding response regulator [Nissabacter sp. SGAir0207]